VTVRFGKPLNFVGQFDGVPLGRARRQVTDVIMNEIQQLSGQEFAGVYNDRPQTID
jgi:1-acyl-sn-glycerol-3-phosphate acyltransferase